MYVHVSCQLIGACERLVATRFVTRVWSRTGMCSQLFCVTKVSHPCVVYVRPRLTCFDKLEDSEKALHTDGCHERRN